MTRHPTSLDPAYFERMFRDSADPWDLESSPYEQGKYDHSIAALQGRTYARGLEVGCAKGVLTHRLAPHCRALLAVDVSETALSAARTRCTDQPHVAFERMTFPRQAPSESGYDLMLLSEVVYYWDDADILRAADWITRHLAPGGDILLVHWTGETDYPQSGDEAVAKLLDALGSEITVMTQEQWPQYRLDLWRVAA